MEGVRAHVRPRVTVNGRGSARSIDSVVSDLASVHEVAITGARGSGRTTALSHLKSLLLTRANVHWIDDAAQDDIERPSRDTLVIYTGPVAFETDRRIVLELAPWGDD